MSLWQEFKRQVFGTKKKKKREGNYAEKMREKSAKGK